MGNALIKPSDINLPVVVNNIKHNLPAIIPQKLPAGFEQDSDNKYNNIIVTRLDNVIHLARSIGIALDEQNSMMLDQYNFNRRILKERLLEKDYTPIPEIESNITEPLQEIFDQLTRHIKTLGRKIDEMEDCCDDSSFGFLDVFKKRSGGRGRKNQTRSRNNRRLRQNRSFSNTNKIKQRLKLGLSGGGLQNTDLKQSVKRLAGPVIQQSLGKTALKSIPIIGAGVGLAFAVDRLLDGDVVGAGLDAVSGVGGPLTAIPALITSISRDVYTNIYGVSPEEDSQSSTRLGEITDTVKEIAKETLSGVVDIKKPDVISTTPKLQNRLQNPAVVSSTFFNDSPINTKPRDPFSLNVERTPTLTPLPGVEFTSPSQNTPTRTGEMLHQLQTQMIESDNITQTNSVNNIPSNFSTPNIMSSGSEFDTSYVIPPEYTPTGINNLNILFDVMYFNDQNQRV